LLTNFHTHTFRCHHASGTEEEYVLRAIEAGVGEMGFSDHGPYPMTNGYCSGFRMSTADTLGYVETLAALREKYKAQIKIYIGFESEYYPAFFEDMIRHVSQYDVDYLILGQHFIYNEIDEGARGSTSGTDDEKLLAQFTEQVCTGMRTGAYCYVAHPDVFNFSGPVSVYKKYMRTLCETAKELSIPLEINGLGIRTNRFYPRDDFWDVAAAVGNSVIYGCDAHDVPNAWDDASYRTACEMAKQRGLVMVERPDFAAHCPKNLFKK